MKLDVSVRYLFQKHQALGGGGGRMPKLFLKYPLAYSEFKSLRPANILVSKDSACDQATFVEN